MRRDANSHTTEALVARAFLQSRREPDATSTHAELAGRNNRRHAAPAPRRGPSHPNAQTPIPTTSHARHRAPPSTPLTRAHSGMEPPQKHSPRATSFPRAHQKRPRWTAATDRYQRNAPRAADSSTRQRAPAPTRVRPCRRRYPSDKKSGSLLPSGGAGSLRSRRSPAKRGRQSHREIRAGDGARTHDIQLGKLTLYQLSYAR